MRKLALFIACLLLIFSFITFIKTKAEILNNKKEREILILKGMSFKEISNKLKSEGMIRSKLIFQIYSLITGKAFKFKPGRYILDSNISVTELTEKLVKGPSEIAVIISPGMTISEIDEKLSALKIIKSGELINSNVYLDDFKEKYPWLKNAVSLEGFLLPDTYYFYTGSEVNLVIHRFLENFNLKVLSFLNNDVNLFKIITLASLLEKEIPDYEEKRIAAGILLKRLESDIPLQVDATLLYAKCAEFLNCPKLIETDYKIDSPYNTYLYAGLPKGPISNPDIESIKAVLNYKKTDYLYYLSDPKTKKTIFSKTLDEHNKNRAKYLLINK